MVVETTFFNFWVEQLWGGFLMSYLGTGALYAIIGLLGRFNIMTLLVLLGAYTVVMGIGFLGVGFFIPIMIFSISYLWININRYVNR